MAGFYLLRTIECEGAEDARNYPFCRGLYALGDFMVVVSGKGLAAVEFGSHRAAVEDALRVRFPECDVTNDQNELHDVLKTVTRAIEEPGNSPSIAATPVMSIGKRR